MLKKILFVVSALALARAQVPSLGWCPEYVPMANFDMSKFLGVWYEAERYFQITEVVSRCVMANYTQSPDGKLRVSNEVTNRFTGIKRILEGEIKPSSGSKADEGKLHVKYTVPFTPETKYAVLDTDYKNYAVMWSCSGIGPINAQNAWLMTRARQPAGDIMQKAYGVLDKYKISKAFFVKTDQADCAYLSTKPEPAKPAPAKPAPAKPSETSDKPVVEVATEEEAVAEAQQAKNIAFRSAIIPDAPAIIADTRNAEIAEPAESPAPVEEAVVAEAAVQSEVQPQADPQPEAKPEIPNAEPIVTAEEIKEELNVVAKAVESDIPAPVSIPEAILKTADRVKEMEKVPAQDPKQFQPFQYIQEALANPAAQFQETVSNNLSQLQDALKDPVGSIQEAIKGQAEKFQDAISKPLEQLQNTFAAPLQNIQQALNRPPGNIPAVDAAPDKVMEEVEKPAEAIKETLNVRAAQPAPEDAAEPAHDPADDLVVEAVQVASEPAQSAPEAAAEPAHDPADDLVVEAVKVASEPAPEPVPEPAAQPAVEAAAEPVVDAVVADPSPVKLPEEIKEKEAVPKEEEEKKIES